MTWLSGILPHYQLKCLYSGLGYDMAKWYPTHYLKCLYSGLGYDMAKWYKLKCLYSGLGYDMAKWYPTSLSVKVSVFWAGL